MAEMYETLQTQTKQGKHVFYGLVVVVILFLALTSFTIYYVVKNPPNNDTSVTLCTTAACISLADEIISSINTSVDPCEDFYHYSCDGWIARNSWRLIDDSEYTQFSAIQQLLKQNFLDEMFFNENHKLTAPDPVQKARTFYDSCFKSTTTEEDIQSTNLMKELIQNINFSISGETWHNPTVSQGFQDAIAYLNQRDWNILFKMNVYYKYDVLMQQNSDFWAELDFLTDDNKTFCDIIHTTYVPLYKQIFDMDQSQAEDAAIEVCDFTMLLYDIGEYPSDYLSAETLYSTYFSYTTLSDFNDIVTDTTPLNLTNIMFKTFQSTNVSGIYYFGEPDITYLDHLSTLITNTDPSIVQLFLFTNILWYFLNYENTWQQTAKISRRDFCYEWTVDQFPFVFGYITGNTLYSDDTFYAVDAVVMSVKLDGMLQLIQDASWLDGDSEETLKSKAALMDLNVGYPESVSSADGITTYYQDVEEMDTNSWLINVERMNRWYTQQTIHTFVNNVFPILDEWPIIFAQTDAFKYWLTGVNAFYYPGPFVDGANYFTIPTTITQEPLFHAEYPSAVNFGGLGSLCGHEISHGFDAIGLGYDLNGSYIDNIVSDSAMDYYEDAVQCYIDQYDVLPFNRNKSALVNGTQTQTENVADNVGLRASYLAWKQYKTTIKETTALPGVDFNEKQLFFWSWSHLWCDANRPSIVANYTNDYTPSYARVVGALQNSQEFADAFHCGDTSFMNPKNKCSVW